MTLIRRHIHETKNEKNCHLISCLYRLQSYSLLLEKSKIAEQKINKYSKCNTFPDLFNILNFLTAKIFCNKKKSLVLVVFDRIIMQMCPCMCTVPCDDKKTVFVFQIDNFHRILNLK